MKINRKNWIFKSIFGLKNPNEGFEDELTRQRSESEKIQNERNQKMERLEAEIDVAEEKIQLMSDELDKKHLQDFYLIFKILFF